MKSKEFLLSINWFGLVTGILLLALPFLGPWWIGRAGTGAMEIALSPFDMNMSFMGLPLGSSLVGLFLLATKITFVIAGVFMILSSLLTKYWWSKRLFRFGVMKPFWSIIGLVVMLAIGAFVANNILPGLLSGMTGGAGGASIQINVPYVSGSSVSSIQVGTTATVTAPITMSLTGIFGVAVATAVLGIIARIYNRRLVPPSKVIVKPVPEREVIKLKPSEKAEERKIIKLKPK